MAKKVVVTAALCGAATMKEQNPNVPYTTEEYVREAKRAEEAGAAIIHVHFREPDTGKPTTDAAIMKEVVGALRENTGLLLNLSTGVGPEARQGDRVVRADVWIVRTGSVSFRFAKDDLPVVRLVGLPHDDDRVSRDGLKIRAADDGDVG